MLRSVGIADPKYDDSMATNSNPKNRPPRVNITYNVASVCSFTKSETPSWAFFTFFKLYK